MRIAFKNQYLGMIMSAGLHSKPKNAHETAMNIHRLGYMRVILLYSHFAKERLSLKNSEKPDTKKKMAFPIAPPTASFDTG